MNPVCRLILPYGHSRVLKQSMSKPLAVSTQRLSMLTKSARMESIFLSMWDKLDFSDAPLASFVLVEVTLKAPTEFQQRT